MSTVATRGINNRFYLMGFLLQGLRDAPSNDDAEAVAQSVADCVLIRHAMVQAREELRKAALSDQFEEYEDLGDKARALLRETIPVFVLTADAVTRCQSAGTAIDNSDQLFAAIEDARNFEGWLGYWPTRDFPVADRIAQIRRGPTLPLRDLAESFPEKL